MDAQGFATTNSHMALTTLATHSRIVIRGTAHELLINYNSQHSYVCMVSLVYTLISWETLYIHIALYSYS